MSSHTDSRRIPGTLRRSAISVVLAFLLISLATSCSTGVVRPDDTVVTTGNEEPELDAQSDDDVAVADATEGPNDNETSRGLVADRDRTGIYATEDEPGHIRVHSDVQLSSGTFVALVPSGPWPTPDETRPAQVLLELTEDTAPSGEAAAIILGRRYSSSDITEFTGRVEGAPSLFLSKSATLVTFLDGASLRLDVRAQDGVVAGDYFFVLGEPRLEPGRLGSRLIGLVQVLDVAADGARAAVVHQMEDLREGATAVFAHHSELTDERPEALILFAQTDPSSAEATFPVLAEALFEYQTEFQFSNIVIETLDAFIDPAAYDGPEQAQNLAPDTGFGVIVFGEERDDDFLYNITTYGASPSGATTVGILAGGLPLETPDGVEALSRELAPSFLATAMAQRGDHAEAIYFLEHCMRTCQLTDSVRFHLREHLALRWESIGRPNEALWVMTEDINRARDTDDELAELNALSIREYINQSLHRTDAELDDLERFLAVAEDVLPNEALLSERLERARVLGRLFRINEAFEALDEVQRQARQQDALRWELSAEVARANLLVRQSNVEEGIELVVQSLPDARVLGESYPRYLHALLAQYYAELDLQEPALTNLRIAVEYAETDNESASLASIYELAANLHFAFDNTAEAVGHMTRAVDLYTDSRLYDDVARALLQLGMLEMTAAAETANPEYFEAAYRHLSDAANTSLAVDNGLRAAAAFGGMGFVNSLLRDASRATVNYSISVDLAYANNSPITVALAYLRTATLLEQIGANADAREALQSARLWAATFEIFELIGQIESLEQALRNEI